MKKQATGNMLTSIFLCRTTRWSAVALLIISSILSCTFLSFYSNFISKPADQDLGYETPSPQSSFSFTQRLALSNSFPSDLYKVDQLFSQVGEGCNNSFIPFHDPWSRINLIETAFNEASLLISERALLENNATKNVFYRLHDFDELNEPEHLQSLGGVALFRNSFVTGFSSMVFNCESIYYPGGCHENPVSKDDFSIRRIMNRTRSIPLQRIPYAVLIAQYWGFGFYHHLVEDIPRIALVLEFLWANPSVKLIAYDSMPQLPRKVREIYNLLGLNSQSMLLRYTPYKRSQLIYVERLLVPTATRCGYGSLKAIRRLQSVFLQRIPQLYATSIADFHHEHGADKRLIVIQSRGSGERSLTNHINLLNALQAQFDYCCSVIEYNGTDTFEQSIVIHYLADIIIGPHGAGLSFIMFAKRGTGLIEIHPLFGNIGDRQPNLCHQRTAKAAGARSIFIHAKDGNESTSFTADVDEVISATRRLLDSNRTTE